MEIQGPTNDAQHRADCAGPWGHLRTLAFTLSKTGALGAVGQRSDVI